MRDIFRGFGAVFYKETLHVRRDAGTLFFSLTMPLLQMFLLGYGVDTNIRHVPTVVYNADGRRESRELIDRFKNTDTFYIDSLRRKRSRHERPDRRRKSPRRHQSPRRLFRPPHSPDERPGPRADRRLRFLHRRTSRQRLQRHRPRRISCAARSRRIATSVAVEMHPKMLFNPDSRSPNFFLPGLTAIMLLNVTTFLTAFSIVREKERGTLEQLFVTPVKPFGLLLGKASSLSRRRLLRTMPDSHLHAFHFPACRFTAA